MSSERLEFHVVSWLERQHGSRAEQRAFGELEIRVGSRILTELEDTRVQTTRTGARVSLLHLARWLASNWWRLRWEPEPGSGDLLNWRLSHDLGAAGGGFLWPAVDFSTDGETVAVRSRATRNGARQPIRYLATVEAVLGAAELERAIDRIVTCVIERLSTLGSPDEELTQLWRTLEQERRDEQLGQLRRREALLGLDAESEAPEVLEELFRVGAWMGGDALDEVLASARFLHSSERVHELAEWGEAPALRLDLATLSGVATAWHAQDVVGRTPWERGADLARSARDQLGIGTQPLSTQDLNDLLSADVSRAPTSRRPSIAAGFRRPAELGSIGAVLRGRLPHSRRFEAARLIGDALDRADTADTVLPITDRSTARQKMQRAFAQEFLCPIQAIETMVSLPTPTSMELDDVAERYEVSDWVVRNALVNRRLVSRDYLPQ